MHLFFVRHGESYVNLPDWDGGFVDAGLTDLGKQQSERVARWMAERLTIDALYTSTMVRARDTAQYIARVAGIEPQPDDRLREFGNCFADGRPVPLDDGARIEYPADWWGTQRPNTRIAPDGESWMLFRARVSAFIEAITDAYGTRDPQATVIAVCHGGVIEAAFDHVFNVGERRCVEIWNHNTGIMHLEYVVDASRDEVWRLHGHSMVYHLLDSDGAWYGAGPVLHHAERSGGDGA